MKYILLSFLAIVTAFVVLSPEIENSTKATAQATVASSDSVDVRLKTAAPADSIAVRSETAAPKADKEKYHLPAYLTDRPEEIITHSAMTISWNDKLRLPNYVAWVLTPERVQGNVKRCDDFQPDPLVKHGTSTTWEDYRGSGFDRGHICPSADNKHTNEAQEECFYMTNMCPQTHSLNAGDWSQIEELCRKWTKEYGKLYIVGGPIINNYPADKQVDNRIEGSNVAIPDAFFKVIMRRGQYGAKAIGFICPNGQQNKNPIDYVVTVDSVEALTGINFFSKLPKAEERKAEASYSLNDWKMKPSK